MQIATITTLATLAAAALQPPPPRFSPPANLFLPASPAVNAWMDANIKPGPDWRPVARSLKGMTLVRWPANAWGTNFTVDLRSEKAPSGQPPADGAQSWTTTYRLDCHANLNGPVGYVTTGLHFTAQAAAGFSGQNLTGEARPIGLGVTLEYPQALFSALCHDHEIGGWKEPPGPADLTNPVAVQAWGQATLDQKGWTSAPAPGGFLFLSDKLVAKDGLRTGEVRLEYFDPRFMNMTRGALIRSARASVEFDCTGKTVRAAGEQYFGRRNLKGGEDDAMPKILTTPPLGPKGAIVPHPNFISAPDFLPGPLWAAFGAKACA